LRVHHLDKDPGNNDPENLTAIHDPCHKRLHHTGKHISSETRLRLAAAQRGKTHSEETRRKISEAGRGRPKSAETRARMSAAHTGVARDLPKFQCGDCDMITIAAGLARHQRTSEHVGRVRIQEEAVAK
jgi:hypothetical protein